MTTIAPAHARADRTRTTESRRRVVVASRRDALALLAAGAAVTVAGRPGKAAAADGNPINQGETNAGTTATTISATDQSALLLASDAGYGVETDGAWGNARFVAGGGSPVGTLAWAGSLWVDGNGNWWAATVSSDTDGQWRKLAGPGTAGALHVLPVPVRVYDSRPGQPPDVGTKAPLAARQPRQVNVTRNASGVPPRARAVLATLTATNTAAAGYVTAWPTGPFPGTSSLNFAPGQTIATTTVVGLDEARFLVQSNTSTDLVVDVVGYYQ